MAALGYAEGQDLAIEYRWADGANEKLATLASELVQGNVELIITIGTPATRAAQAATRTVPIVMVSVASPVESGLVTSLAHPGANITGVSNFVGDTTVKLLDILVVAVPKLSRVGVLLNPSNPSTGSVYKGVDAACRALDKTAVPAGARSAAEIDAAFATMGREGVQAFFTLADPFLFDRRSQVTRLAASSRLPAIYNSAEYVEAGGLMSYGVNTVEVHRTAAVQVDKVLRGAPPAEIPVEQPTLLELVLNPRAAGEMGLALPLTLLARADRLVS